MAALQLCPKGDSLTECLNQELYSLWQVTPCFRDGGDGCGGSDAGGGGGMVCR